MAKTHTNGADDINTKHQNGDNVTDEVRREWYRWAMMAKIGVESAQSLVKAKNAELKDVLKKARKVGVDTDAITRTLKVRFQDEDELIGKMREQLTMLDLAGIVPNIKEKLLARLDVQEPTASGEAQWSQDRAYDAGAFDYRSNIGRDDNKFIQGTSLFDAWDRGWLFAQSVTASEMVAESPAAVQ